MDNDEDKETEEAINRTGMAIAAEATVAAAAVTSPGDDLPVNRPEAGTRAVEEEKGEEEEDKEVALDLTKIAAYSLFFIGN